MTDSQITAIGTSLPAVVETADDEGKETSSKSTAITYLADVSAIESAVNEAAKRINAVWLAFIFLMTYVLISTGKISHRDLFLETPVKLPILGVDVPLRGYFFLVPAFVVAIHFYFSIQMSGLASKFMEYERSLLDAGIKPDHVDRLRHRLDNSIFAKILGGPWRRLDVLLRSVGWISMGIAPPWLILFIQLTYLPQQDGATTFWHRSLLMVDALLIIAYVLPLMLRNTRVIRTQLSSKNVVARIFNNNRWSGFVVTTIGTSVAIWVGVFVAVFPSERMFFRELTTAWLMPDEFARSPANWFSNRLILKDQNLIDGIDITKVEVTRSLRDRSFVAAIFDRADLRQVDFIGSDLTLASFREAQLQKAYLSCAWFTDSGPVGCARLIGTDFTQADLRGASLSGAIMYRAVLTRAKLDGATLYRTQLQGAQLNAASLDATLLDSAGLDGASLTNASLVGARLHSARLRGANLNDARLIGAALDGSLAQNASFEGTQLQGASMRFAHFEGAYFAGVAIYGIDASQSSFDGARITNILTSRLWFVGFQGDTYAFSPYTGVDMEPDPFGKDGDSRPLLFDYGFAEDDPDPESAKYFAHYFPIPESEEKRLKSLFPGGIPEVRLGGPNIQQQLSRLAPNASTANWSPLTARVVSVDSYRRGLGDRVMIIACAKDGRNDVTLGLLRNGLLCPFWKQLNLVVQSGKRIDGNTCENVDVLKSVATKWDEECAAGGM